MSSYDVIIKVLEGGGVHQLDDYLDKKKSDTICLERPCKSRILGLCFNFTQSTVFPMLLVNPSLHSLVLAVFPWEELFQTARKKNKT